MRLGRLGFIAEGFLVKGNASDDTRLHERGSRVLSVGMLGLSGACTGGSIAISMPSVGPDGQFVVVAFTPRSAQHAGVVGVSSA